MEPAGYRRLFCAKLVRMAYDMASGGRVLLPTCRTALNMRNPDFLRRIGVTARETFAPGDLELEADFDLIAEWRDFRVTSELRQKDMIMTKLFEWMDIYGYKFRPDLAIRAIGLLGRLSTHLSSGLQDLVAEVVGRVPANMSYSAIGAVAMLHKTAEPIYKELDLLETETIRNSGYQLHPRRTFEVLEDHRRRHGRRIGYLVR